MKLPSKKGQELDGDDFEIRGNETGRAISPFRPEMAPRNYWSGGLAAVGALPSVV